MITFVVSTMFNKTVFVVNSRLHVERNLPKGQVQAIKQEFKNFLDFFGPALLVERMFIIVEMDFLQDADKICVCISTSSHTFELTYTIYDTFCIRIIEKQSKTLVKAYADIYAEKPEWLEKIDDLSNLNAILEHGKNMSTSEIAKRMFVLLFQLLHSSILIDKKK